MCIIAALSYFQLYSIVVWLAHAGHGSFLHCLGILQIRKATYVIYMGRMRAVDDAKLIINLKGGVGTFNYGWELLVR
jgi:hypothetical protein